jgi:hypothetical protein
MGQVIWRADDIWDIWTTPRPSRDSQNARRDQAGELLREVLKKKGGSA